MTLFKTSFWTSISTLLKAILTYAMWKIIAVNTGPSGVALIEQFQNFLQIIRSSVPCGINAGVIKYVAEYKNNQEKKSDVLSNAIAMHFIFCFIISIVLIAFSHKISGLIFQTFVYQKVIIFAAVSTLLFVLNNFILAIFNGELDVKKYIFCTILNTILNFVVTVILVIHYGLLGGLIGFALNQTLVAFVTIFFLVKSKWFKFKCIFEKLKISYIKKLSKYSLMVFTTTFITPCALIIIRKYIMHSFTLEYAGYWQGIMRLSEGYLIIMNMVFSFYFIPRFSGTQTIAELRKEVILSYKYIFPLILFGVVFVFLLKKQIILILYSREFLPMISLFKYQLIGDIARMGTWLLTNILFAKALVKTFVTVEVFFSLTYVLLSVIFIHYFGFVGSAIGFAVNYVLHWLFMIIFSILFLGDKQNFLKFYFKH